MGFIMASEDNSNIELTFDFSVNNFSKLERNQNNYSREYTVADVRWKGCINVLKKSEKEVLKFYLYSRGETKLWSCNARVRLTILSTKNHEPINRSLSFEHLFSSAKSNVGYREFIDWDTLVNPEFGYIKDDTVKFQVHIVADPPQYVDPNYKKVTVAPVTSEGWLSDFEDRINKRIVCHVSEEFKTVISVVDEGFQSVKDQIDAVKENIDEVQEEISEMKDDINTLKALSGIVGAVKEDIETVTEDVGTLKQDISTVKDYVSSGFKSVEDQNDAVKENIDEAQEKISEIKEGIDTVKEDVGTLKQDISTVKDHVSFGFVSVKNQNDAVEDHVSSRFKCVEDQNDTVIENIGEAQVEISKLKEDINTLKPLSGIVGTVKEDIGTLKQDISTVKDHVSSVNSAIDELKNLLLRRNENNNEEKVCNNKKKLATDPHKTEVVTEDFVLKKLSEFKNEIMKEFFSQQIPESRIACSIPPWFGCTEPFPRTNYGRQYESEYGHHFCGKFSLPRESVSHDHFECAVQKKCPRNEFGCSTSSSSITHQLDDIENYLENRSDGDENNSTDAFGSRTSSLSIPSEEEALLKNMDLNKPWRKELILMGKDSDGKQEVHKATCLKQLFDLKKKFVEFEVFEAEKVQLL